jgi:predicted alpha/beta-fold hydrolase
VYESKDVFFPSWWLPGAHLQTVWGRLARPRRLVMTHREILPTPDGDEVVLDHLEGAADAPLVILLHGLEGSSSSVYIQGLLQQLQMRRWRAVAVNFRSCARDPQQIFRMLPNRTSRLYHSGETEDFDFVLQTMAGRNAGAPLLAFGASLGGNVLLKWLGEHPGDQRITAAATMSVPYDLAAGSSHLESAAGGVYVKSFLRTLKKKAIDVARKFPETNLDGAAIEAARTFREFDDLATGPLHQFRDAADYYERSSSINFIGRITVPTLAISSEDDPFLPSSVLDRVEKLKSPKVTFVRTRQGGHAGFVSGGSPWSCWYWGEETVAHWFEGALD